MSADSIFLAYVVLVIGIFLCFTFPLFASAQFFDSQSEARLSLDPNYPSPYSEITVTLEAYAMNTTGAEIIWFIDGKEYKDGRNERSIVVMSGDLGESTSIEARVTLPSGALKKVLATIRPVDIDIVFEADTVAPTFYRGRTLPTPESNVRAIAIVHTGNALDQNNLSYEWRLGNTVLSGGAIRGKTYTEFAMPKFGGAIFSVAVYGQNGALLGEKLLELTPTNPELYFYEDNPLRGMNRKAMGNDFILVGDEVSVRAEPYFISTTDSRSNQFTWLVDGKSVTLPDDPRLITLRRGSGSGTSNIDLQIVNFSKIFQNLKNSFSISFN